MDSNVDPGAGLSRLAAFADELRASGSHATVETGTVGPYSSVSLLPRRNDALGIGWLASDSEVVLSAGGGRWELEPKDEDLAVLEDIVRSVMAGRVSEAKRRRWSRVDVTLSDGTVETSKVYDGLQGTSSWTPATDRSQALRGLRVTERRVPRSRVAGDSLVT